MAIPRGKGLGGSSILNFMVYSRGTKTDFDNWEKLGNEGWSYDDVLPYFLKSEGAHGLTKADWNFHNKDGPLSIENTYQSLVVKSAISAGKDIGIPYVDYNSPLTPLGFSPAQSHLRHGKRFSAARAYLEPIAKNRSNLDIVTSALVTKLLINDQKKAYGVQYEKGKKTYSVRARKEVILSAGAINTPQILMLAGIGPKDHLDEMGIPCVQSLAVGKHLIDHLTFHGVVFNIYFDIDQTTLRYILTAPEIIMKGKGPLSTLGGVEGVGFVKTNLSTYEEDNPDIEFLFIRGHLASDHGNWIRPAFRLQDDLYEKTFKPLEKKPCWTIAPVLLHPESEGQVKLKSTDPHHPPLIYANYFTDKNNNDIKRFIAGIRIIEKLEKTRAFRSNGAKLSNIPIHGCQHHELRSDAYWECALRTMSNTLYHQMGTCKMGPREDPTSVVDSRFRVHGMESLRVVDASIIPFISGHINAVCIMFGEKASDMIKEDYGEL
ncbi:glucose dehydrogenase [FAD, quinone] [Leptinotarsa decemlineata]|uniref:glucose dehydrogenase [FAD, quinone] n=1 Tax=Leptinotarsa decemlineata TaxID=7539 RepID=UPI003D3049C1